MHTGCHQCQFARNLQLKNISLWPVDRRPRWESSPGWNRSRDCSLQFVRQKLKRVGRKGRFENGVYDRRWQADGFRLRQRRGERKRKIFHGFHSVVAIACYSSGEHFLASNVFSHRIRRVKYIYLRQYLFLSYYMQQNIFTEIEKIFLLLLLINYLFIIYV